MSEKRKCDGIPEQNAREILQPYVEKGQIAGAVALVASKDKILLLEAVGFSDLKTKEPMSVNSLFWIASMTKPMTATAFMMLVDEGKVQLDDPVEKFLPYFKGQMVIAEKDEEHTLLKKPSRPITMRDLLSHTSGLPFSSPIEHPFDVLPLNITTKSYASGPLYSEPGEKYTYSNAGINTAGYIIETISGMPYEQFMQERLLGPLGMKSTTFWPSAGQTARLAKSYKVEAETNTLSEIQIGQLRYPLNDRLHRFPMPAGGYFSTAKDVAKFCQMILNGGVFAGKRLLSETALKEMTSRQTKPTMDKSYGLGWNVDPDKIGHGGAYNTSLDILPQKGIATVYLTQISTQGDFGGVKFNTWAKAKFGKNV